MRKAAIVDWDDTLFDIEEFKREYFRFLGHHIFTYAGFVDLINIYEKAKAKGWYDADEHIRLLVEKSPIEHNREKVIEDIKRFIQETSQKFLFSDAEPFLKYIANLGYTIYFVTLGTEWFQQSKIEHSGLAKYGLVTVTQDPTKIKEVKNLRTHVDRVLIFDDSKKVIEEVRNNFPRDLCPEIKAMYVWRRGDRPPFSADAIISNLSNVEGLQIR